MKKVTIAFTLCFVLLASLAFAQVFPPVWQSGPFPTGTEVVRDDAPCAETIPDELGTIYEYTAYRGTPTVDGDVDNDPVWNSIPWTVMNQYTIAGGESCYIFDGACDAVDNYWGFDDITAWFKILWDDDHVYFALKKIDNEYVYDDTHMGDSQGNIWQDDAYQIVLDANDPFDQGGPMPSAEIGVALLDYTEAAYNSWRNTNGDPLAIADGGSESTVLSGDGKMFFGSQKDHDTGGYEEVMEIAFVKWDEIEADTPQMFSIMANDPDEDHTVDALEWSRGIFNGKLAERYGSIVYSSSAAPAGLTDFTDLGGIIEGSNDDLPWTGPDSDGSPDAEKIPMLIDNDINTKYLVGAEQSWIDYWVNDHTALITEYTLTSANDAPGRDPRSWELQGWDFATGAWETLHSVADQDTFETRFMTKKWSFENDKWYSKYRLNILGINGDTDGLMQIAEWELLGQVETAVADNKPAQPNEFALSQNYPNPFNPTTTISYAVKTTGNVELTVYDLLGHQVASLVNKVQNPGVYNVTFDAQDLSSGVYIYTLKSANAVMSNKMVLMK